MSQTLIKHEPGRRLLVLEEPSGKVVETFHREGRILRRVPGDPIPSVVYEGSPEEAEAVLDGLASVLVSRAAPAAPAPVQVPAPAVVAPGASRHKVGLLVAANVAAVLALGGYVAYKDLRPAPASPEAVAWKAPFDPADLVPRAPQPDPVSIPDTVTGDAAPRMTKAVGQRPDGAPPSVALPGAEPAKAVENATVTEAPVGPRSPLRGSAIGLAKQEAAPLTKNTFYGSQAAPTVLPPGSSPVAVQAQANSMPKAPAPAAAVAQAPTPAPASGAKASKPVQPAETVTQAPVAGTASALASKAEVARQESEASIAAARKDVGEKGVAQTQADKDKLMAVLTSLERGEKISKAVVSQLDHEVAQRLRDAGVVASDEDEAILAKATTGQEYRIVRLPSSALDKYRDKDGIATIPDSNSWAATGGNVRIPLPGGGEMKTAEDMRRAFGLQP